MACDGGEVLFSPDSDLELAPPVCIQWWNPVVFQQQTFTSNAPFLAPHFLLAALGPCVQPKNSKWDPLSSNGWQEEDDVFYAELRN